MTLVEANLGNEYLVEDIKSDDDELVKFLFSLGCYKGEPITIIDRKKNNMVLAIKDARYNVDVDLANAILV